MKKVFLVLFMLTGAVSFAEAENPEFVINTEQRFGFTRNNEFYSLGTNVDEFHHRFGAAEKAEKDDDDQGYLAHTVTDYYVSQGLMVTAKTDGKIIGFVFYLIPSQILKVARAETDRGIKAGSTEKDTTKIYGKPFREKHFKDEKYDDRDLYYRFGDSVLSFRFDHGALKAIALNSDYLPYLEK